MRGPTQAPPIPKFPVEGKTSVCSPGAQAKSSCFSTRIEYAGPTLCEPVGKCRPDRTTIGARTPVSASGRTVNGTVPRAFQERFQRFSGSSGRSRASLALARRAGSMSSGSCISAKVGP